MSKSFISIHNHSHFSIGDSIIKEGELARVAQEQGVVAVTDHGSISSWIYFNKKCEKQGVKPIFGIELYCTPSYEASKQRGATREHLILLAKNSEGLKQIQKLQVESNHHYHHRPIIEYGELLDMEQGNLIGTSACAFGHLSNLIINNKPYAELEDAYYEFYDFFGKDLYIELQPHFYNEFKEQSLVNEKLMQLSDKVSGKSIITTDAHYLKGDMDYRTMSVARIYKKSYEEQLNGKYKTLSTNYYCSSYNEIKELVDNYNKTLPNETGYIDEDILNKCCKNTVEIANKCNASLPGYKKHIPLLPEEKQQDLLDAYGVTL